MKEYPKVIIEKTSIRNYTKEELDAIQIPETILKINTLIKNKSWMPEVIDIDKRENVAAIQIIAGVGKNVKKKLIQRYLQKGTDPIVYGTKILERYREYLLYSPEKKN